MGCARAHVAPTRRSSKSAGEDGIAREITLPTFPQASQIGMRTGNIGNS
jgi:hypothetical protein